MSMLTGLVLAGVQAARARARVTQCSNNQRNIGQAIIEYDTAKRRLPGFINRIQCTGGTATGYRAVSWAVTLLPNIGRQDLWEGTSGTNSWRSGDPKGDVLSRVNLFVCPDCVGDTDEPTQLSYVVNVGSSTLGCTKLSGSTTTYNPDYETGVLRNLVQITGSTATTPISLSNVRTTSRRPMLSEARYPIDTTTDYAPTAEFLTGYIPKYSTMGDRVWSGIASGTSTFALGNITGQQLTGLQLGFPWPATFGDQNSTVTFGQILPPVHAGIVIVTFCDGHVESLDAGAECSAYDSTEIR